MSNWNQKIIDGYALNSGDGYSFVSNFFDVKNALAYSISCTFSGGTPTGTLSLNCSNESDIASPMGYSQANSPATGSTAMTMPADQPMSGGLDSCQILNATSSISTTGTTVFDVSFPGHRWVQLVYAGSADVGVLVTAWINVKW